MSLFRVLLIDNDVGLMTPYAEALRQAGCEVDLASTLTSAEDFLAARQYDSVVLDVMIPTRSDFEEAVYRPVSTRGGMESGLEFYKRFRSNLEVTKTAVLVMTVRLDDNIKQKFIAAGLDPERFATKVQFRDLNLFVRRVRGDRTPTEE